MAYSLAPGAFVAGEVAQVTPLWEGSGGMVLSHVDEAELLTAGPGGVGRLIPGRLTLYAQTHAMPCLAGQVAVPTIGEAVGGSGMDSPFCNRASGRSQLFANGHPPPDDTKISKPLDLGRNVGKILQLVNRVGRRGRPSPTHR